MGKMDIITSMVRNLRVGALTRYEHFEKIKERLPLKNCVTRKKKKIYMHVACTYYATIKVIGPSSLEKQHIGTPHTLCD
jgi:hypothetical protein